MGDFLFLPKKQEEGKQGTIVLQEAQLQHSVVMARLRGLGMVVCGSRNCTILSPTMSTTVPWNAMNAYCRYAQEVERVKQMGGGSLLHASQGPPNLAGSYMAGCNTRMIC